MFGRGTDPVSISYMKPRTYLQQMADATGGVLITEPDLGAGLERMTSAERGRYVLGYYADEVLDRKSLGESRGTSRRANPTPVLGFLTRQWTTEYFRLNCRFLAMASRTSSTTLRLEAICSISASPIALPVSIVRLKGPIALGRKS